MHDWEGQKVSQSQISMNLCSQMDEIRVHKEMENAHRIRKIVFFKTVLTSFVDIKFQAG